MNTTMPPSSDESTAFVRRGNWLASPPLMAAAIGLLLLLPALWIGLQMDDYGHRFILLHPSTKPGLSVPPWDLFAILNGDPVRTHAMMDAGVLPWWTYDHMRIALCRPLSAMTHWLDYQLWPTRPMLMPSRPSPGTEIASF